jgi:hypothetical protein
MPFLSAGTVNQGWPVGMIPKSGYRFSEKIMPPSKSQPPPTGPGLQALENDTAWRETQM